MGDENAEYCRREVLGEKSPAGCALAPFTGSNFVGAAVVADVEFARSLREVNRLASANGVDVFVTQSFRPVGVPVAGAIVKPAAMSNHLAGHAIDMNVQYGPNRERLCNSKCLAGALPAGVAGFIADIQSSNGLRWGGDFTPRDTVHIDDHLNANEVAWRARFRATQTARRDQCG
jgi:hypothetical protein